MISAELVSELRSLKALCDDGVITADEFSAKKAQLLNLPPPTSQPASASKPTLEGRTKSPSASVVAPARTGSTLVLADCGGKGVMATGDTLRAKSHLKAMGGRWDAKLCAWMLSGKSIAQLTTELEQRGITVRADEQMASTTADDASVGAIQRREAELLADKKAVCEVGAKAQAGAKLTLTKHKKAVLLCGQTSLVKDMLRALDGKWIGSLGGYCHPGSMRDELLAALRADPTNEVVDETSSPRQSKPDSSKRRRGEEDEEEDEEEAFE